jgi:hypothetical protein
LNVLPVLEVLGGILLIVLALIDTFETVVLPRTVKRSFRLTAIFFAISRVIYIAVDKTRNQVLRQRLLSAFAPITLFNLIGAWAALIILGFAMVGAGYGTTFRDGAPSDFANRLYFSSSTFITFAFGDFVPISGIGKLLAVLEGGMGFGFLALVIGYVPVFYNAFSRREQTILLLDSKAGSEPSACEILRRHAAAGCLEDLPVLLKDWEQFSGQLLENFLSYPILAFYRSQHDEQSWLNSLCAVMDACTLCIAFYPGDDQPAKRIRFQAESTFMMARHLIVDFSYVISCEPMKPDKRLFGSTFDSMLRLIADAGLTLKTTDECLAKFKATRELYEPFATGLANRLKMELPQWLPLDDEPDNWETSAWDGKHF